MNKMCPINAYLLSSCPYFIAQWCKISMLIQHTCGSVMHVAAPECMKAKAPTQQIAKLAVPVWSFPKRWGSESQH